MFIKADTMLEPPQCVLVVSCMPLTPTIILYICMSFSQSMPPLPFSRKTLVSVGQEIKLHCLVTPSMKEGHDMREVGIEEVHRLEVQ